jgi:hypothetical protein
MTQRKRATGFALMDTAFAADAKFVRLARKAPNEVAFAAAVGVFWLILADCRRARSAIVHWEDYTEYGDQIASLKDAGLLTTNGFIPESFDNWAPAYKAPTERTQSSPTVPNGTGLKGGSEHGASPSVPDGNAGTESTVTSPHINSPQVTNGVGGAGEGAAPVTMMGWRGKGFHDGRHGPNCMVCHPPRSPAEPTSTDGLERVGGKWQPKGTA